MSPPSEAVVVIPSGVAEYEGTSKLATVAFKALSYSWAMSDNQVRYSPLFSVNLYCDTTKQIVENLDQGLRPELKLRSKRGKALLPRLSSG